VSQSSRLPEFASLNGSIQQDPPNLSDRIKQLILSDLGHPKYKQQALRFALEKYKAPLSAAKARLKRLAKNGLKRRAR